MTVFEIYSRGNEKCWLYSDDTFTLALSDAADPEQATETAESTPKDLATWFDFPALLALYENPVAREDGKLARSLRIAATMPDGLIA